jgi:hypothetical protein
MKRVITHTLALLAGGILAGGCDLLSTREPERPQQQTTYLAPTTPEAVLQNFSAAINARDATGYGRCFADSTRGGYHFLPAGDAQQYAARFAAWTARDEVTYFQNLRAQVSADNSLSVFLDSLATETASPDSVVFSAHYTMIARHADPSRPTETRGRMYLTMRADGATQQWAIARWVDVAVPPDVSWSVLKARFAP